MATIFISRALCFFFSSGAERYLAIQNRGTPIAITTSPIKQITSNSAADATRWVQYSHYSLLATVEAIFNLGTLGRNDTSATPMSDLFRGGIP